MAWLEQRFTGADNSMHFLGNCLIEFAGCDHRPRRNRPACSQATCCAAKAWGRYLDHFERRADEWRAARRVGVIEAGYTSVALGGRRSPSSASTWGSRDATDLVWRGREELFAKAAAAKS